MNANSSNVSYEVDLFDWINSKGSIDSYTEWRNHPVTKVLKQGIFKLLKVYRLNNPTSETALQSVGYHAGRFELYDLVFNLLDIIDIGDSAKSIDEAKIEYLVKFEGRTTEDATRIVAKYSEEL